MAKKETVQRPTGFVGFDNPTEEGNPVEANGQNQNEDVQGNNSSEDDSNEANRQPTPAGDIFVNVTDPVAPIVLLFGAKSTGKTMTLVRLGKYLRTQGYSLSVDMNFCTSAWEYAVNARNFNKMLNTTRALKGTDHNDFLFVKINDNRGHTVCQILEAAGEDYFPTEGLVMDRANEAFPAYMTEVFNQSNKKVWMFLLDPTWTIANDRSDFVQRISFCKNNHFDYSKDKCVILYNKIDKTPYALGATAVNDSAAKANCSQLYQGVFELFAGGTWLSPDLYEFVPFCTGSFPSSGAYTPSHQNHPAKLWKNIKKVAGIR